MNARRRASAAALLVALALAAPTLSACAASPEDDPYADLQARVEVVRAAVGARDAESARSALSGLREAVVEHRLDGEIEAEQARSIITAAAEVEERLGELETPPPEEGDEETSESDDG